MPSRRWCRLIGRTGLQWVVALTPDTLVTNRCSGGCDLSVPGSGHLSDVPQAERPFDGVGCTIPRVKQGSSAATIANNMGVWARTDPTARMFFCKYRTRSVSLSLTDLDPGPSAPEAVVQLPLRTVWLLLTEVASNLAQTVSRRTPSFLSDNPPPDRHGRIGDNPKNTKISLGDPGSSAWRIPMLWRRGASRGLGRDDYVLVGEDEFEWTSRITRDGWVGMVPKLYLDEERVREG